MKYTRDYFLVNREEEGEESEESGSIICVGLDFQTGWYDGELL